MLLAIDVGNTNIVLGVFDGATLVQSWRLQTLRERTSDELGLLVDGLFAHSRIERVRIRGIILGSVVPPLTGTIGAMVQRYFGVAALSRRYEDLLAGRFDAILDAWRRLAPAAAGARVTWTTPAGAATGVTAGVDDRGALLVRVDGRIERIVSGEVSWL